MSRQCDILVAKLEEICSTPRTAVGSKKWLNDTKHYHSLTENVLATVESNGEWETES